MSKLEEMLKYVSEHNEFYKNRIKEYGITDPLDITQWPILTRKELQENRYNMFSDGYMTKYSNQQLYRRSSSGSSGVPVNVYWDYKDLYATSMALWRKRRKWYGIKANDKGVILSLSSFNLKADSEMVYYLNEPSNMLYINISLIQSEAHYIELSKLINDFDPLWLYVQPFMLDKLVRLYKQYEFLKPKSLRYIESYGEILSSDIRTRASKFFDLHIVNMYGAEEVGAIAFESPKGDMFILEDNVYIETKKNDIICPDGEGDFLVTSLNNHAMPLIRYSLGDSGVTSSRISDGKQIREVVTIKGRTVDTIKLEKDMELNTIFLMEVIAEANNLFNDCIVDYKYSYHKSNNTLVCNIVIKEKVYSCFDNIKKEIVKIFNKKILSKAVKLEVIVNSKASFKHCKNRILEFI